MNRRLMSLLMMLLLVAMAGIAAGCEEGDAEDAVDTAVAEAESAIEDAETAADEAMEDAETAMDEAMDAGDGMTLMASVGPGFEISLTDADGNPVEELSAGEYTIKVNDQSDQHNFHLTGEGVDESTTVEEVAETEWTVTLNEGEYEFVCDPHASSMNGSFTVTA